MDRSKNLIERLSLLLKERDKKLTRLNCQKRTSEVKIKLLQDQVEMLENDLHKQHDNNAGDNLNDAIEVEVFNLKLKLNGLFKFSDM